MNSPVIVALDYASDIQALNFVHSVEPSLCRLKVGKAMFTRFGPQLVKQLIALGFDVFLDLKYHDIPNTVGDAVKAAADLGVWMVNVHASGGEKMLTTASDALNSFAVDKPLLIAVTVLTSLDQGQLNRLGLTIDLVDYVLNLAKLSHESGLDGVVCSAGEVPIIKQIDTAFCCVTPGIRISADIDDDQSRVMTPKKAIESGSDYLVIGRPITQAKDPHQTLTNILQTLK